MEYVGGFLALAFAAVFAASAYSRGRAFAARSRLDLVLNGLDAAAALVFARAMMPWAEVSTVLWFVPVAVVAAGVFGAVLRWSQLPALRPERPRWRSWLYAALHLVVYAAVVLVFAV